MFEIEQGAGMKTAIGWIGLAIWLSGALCSGAVAAQPPKTLPAAPASDPDMKRIYDADQADRSVDITKMDWAVVGPRDAARHVEVRQLLAEGRLHTGADFVEAALVFQHSTTSDDFLLAHTLAVIATKKGDPGGPWIAAATLDRYLQTIGQKQIYGTQMSTGLNGWTRGAYDSGLISDALRKELGVPDLAGQARQLEERQASGAPPVVVTPVEAPQSPVKADIKCETGPVMRVFGRTSWQVFSCDNGGLLALDSGPPPGTIFVTVTDGKVIAGGQGGDDAEVKVATAAFEAMTEAQIADIIAQTRQVSR